MLGIVSRFTLGMRKISCNGTLTPNSVSLLLISPQPAKNKTQMQVKVQEQHIQKERKRNWRLGLVWRVMSKLLRHDSLQFWMVEALLCLFTLALSRFYEILIFCDIILNISSDYIWNINFILSDWRISPFSRWILFFASLSKYWRCKFEKNIRCIPKFANCITCVPVIWK